MSVIDTQNYDHLTAIEIKAVQDAAKEAAKSLLRSDAEKELRTDIATKIKDEYGISKSHFNYLAMRYHKQDQQVVTATFENKNALFDKVFPETPVDSEED